MKNIDNYMLYLLILILPIFFYSQNLLTVCVVIIILLTKIIKITLTGKISLSTGSFDIPILLIATSYLLSTIFASPNKMNAIISPGTTTLIVLSVIIYYLINQISLKEKLNLTYFLFAGVIIYSVLTLLTATKTIPQLMFNNYLEAIFFIITLLPIMISIVFKQKEFANKLLISISIFIAIFALAISVISNKAKYLNIKTSVNIATNVLKQNSIIGIGSGNYLEGFNKYRPFEYNNTKLWANKFESGSSFILTNLTEVGILGTFTFLALLAIFVNFAINEFKNRKKVGWGFLGSLDLLSIISIFISLIVFPSFPIQIFILFILLGIVSESKKHNYIIPSKITSVFITFPMLVLLFFTTYKIYIISFAEYNYLQSLKSLSQNKAKETYDLLKKAINLNSKVDRYHRVMSSINFAIASSLSKKQDINDKDKEQVALLVQESINEAKAAVSINNKSAENWEFLGKTYHLLIPFAKGSDKFALDSYKQAINLDPINPTLRIKLGEVYMLQKDYKNAIDTFKLAVLAKDDHPNAHFNLAIASKENGEIEKAKLEFNKTLELITSNSDNYNIVKQELEKIEKLTIDNEI